MSEMKFKVKFGKTRSRQTSQKPVPCFAGTEEFPTRSPVVSAAQPLPVSRTARLLALAYYAERQIDAGAIKAYADAARVLGMSRARMSHVIDLLLLPAEVQQGILTGAIAVTERGLRATLDHWPRSE